MTKAEQLRHWITTEMTYDKPYLIKGEAVQAEIKRLVEDRFGWPKFFLQLSKDLLSFTKHSITISKSKSI